MKKKYFLNTFLMLAIALSPLAVIRAASLIGQNYGTDLEIPARIDLDLDAGADTDMDTDTDTAEDIDTDTSASAEFDASATGEEITVERGDIDFSTDLSTVRLVNSVDVATENDLRAYAETIIRSDENIESVSFDGGRVEVSYKTQGHLIGILPMDMDLTVRVNQDGEVEFDYPWYGFLVEHDEEELETEVRAGVEAALAEEAEGGWTSHDRAEIAEAITLALSAYYEEQSGDTAE